MFNTDTGKEYVEFRAQCEVWLSASEAETCQKLISVPRAQRNRAQFDEALKIILRRADDAGAKPEFKEILKLSFQAQPEYKQSMGASAGDQPASAGDKPIEETGLRSPVH